MNKVKIVSLVTRIYFLAAMTASFTHIITAAHKIGLTGWEAWSTPFMIDGLAVIGLVMRSEGFSKATRRTGFRTQITAGMISLVANVYAAHNLGGIVYGVGVVALFLAAEWLSGRIEGAEVDEAAAQEAAALAAKEKRSAAAQKAAATRKRKTTQRKREAKVLDDMLAR